MNDLLTIIQTRRAIHSTAVSEETLLVGRMALIGFLIGVTCFISLLGVTLSAQAQLNAPNQSGARPQAGQTNSITRYAQYRDAANQNVVTIISGNPNGSFLYTAYDISTVLEHNSKIRVMPIVGRGGAQNVKDVLYLKGVDMGIMQPHVIQYFKQTGEVGPNIDKRIAYITTLFADELHVLARSDIKSFEDLAGKRVNFSNLGSGTQISMRLIFKALGIKVQEVNVGQGDAFEMMKQGKLDATTCSCAKPLRSFRELNRDTGFKLLAVPYTPELEKTFFPGLLTHRDYPQLIPAGQSINTVAVQTILGVYNWKTQTTERYRRVTKFINAFFDNIKEFHKPPRQEKWKSINLAASVPGLKRFAPAQKWLERNASSGQLKTSNAQLNKQPTRSNRARPKTARATPNKQNEQDKLFKQFLNWVQGGQPNER